MRNRRWICLLLAVLMVLACTACGAKANDGASGDMRTLTDGKNRTVEVPKQVERVVCVGVGALRYSCYVGAADRAVGVEDYETKAGMSRLYNYVNFDKFKDLPVTGTNGEPYVEQIIDVAPQVIVMSAYASCDADELSAKTGIPVFVVPGSDTTLDDAAYETIRLLGELYGLETRAQELTKYLKGIQTDLDTRTAKIADDQKPSVYVGGVSFKGQHGFEGTEAGYGRSRSSTPRTLQTRPVRPARSTSTPSRCSPGIRTSFSSTSTAWTSSTRTIRRTRNSIRV